MIHSCYCGDLKMCRFLLSRGASTTESSADGAWFPLTSAATNGQIDVLEWLCKNGAKEDIKRVDETGETMLHWIANNAYNSGLQREDKKVVVKWLILNGALEESPEKLVLEELMRRDIDPENYKWLLSWAEEAVNTHSCFQVFLMGTLLPEFSVTSLRQLLASKLNSVDVATAFIGDIPQEKLEWYWQSLVFASNSVLNGKPGVLEHISKFVGVVRERELRLKRQLAEKLKPLTENGYSE